MSIIELTYKLVGAADAPDGESTSGPFDVRVTDGDLTVSGTAPDIETFRGQFERWLFSSRADGPARTWRAAANTIDASTGTIVVEAHLLGSHRDTYVYGPTGPDRWGYRWSFTRRFDPGVTTGTGTACWVMLNPSASDVVSSGSRRTLQRVTQETRAFGHRDIHIVNLFAARAASAKELRQLRADGLDIIGPRADGVLDAAAATAARVICAWGSGGKIARRGAAVARRLEQKATEVWCLGQAKTGQPFHPTAERSGHATLARQRLARPVA